MNAKQLANGDYDPSTFTQWFGTSSKTDYLKQTHAVKYTGNKPILVICTDEGRFKMANDKVFSTENHPVEMLVPMLHFQDAGYTFEVATTSGKAVVLEMWANPEKDVNVQRLVKELQPQIQTPKKIQDIKNLDAYSGVFIPEGHGAMINLPTNADLGTLLHEAHTKQIPTVTLCHGPSALLASAQVPGKDFAYEGYEIMCFTDKTDGFTPMLGYLPGKMPWKCQEALEKQGIKVINKDELGAVNVDRELITGDSPKAAQNLGVKAAPILVEV